LRNKELSPLKLVFNELVWPFWSRSEERWRARGLLALTVCLIFAMVYSLVLLNTWNQAFYDSIQKLDRAEFVHQLWRFFYIALAYALVVAFKFFTLQSLALRWRTWMTEKNLNRWLREKNFYQWQLAPRENDNPDQRLSEDIYALSDLTLEIVEKVFRETITFVSFIGILWGLSGSLHFSALGWNFEFHRYLVVICLCYAVAGTWVVHKIGRPLSALHFFQQRFEADFRFLLVRLRENAESIAVAEGEPAEKRTLFGKFSEIAKNYKDIISRQRDVMLTSNIYGQLAYIFPFVVASSKVFTREITLGQLFQISSAFGQVQGSVSVFIDLYAKIARWYSVVVRLGGFLNSLSANEEQRKESAQSHAVISSSAAAAGAGAALRVAHLRLRTPQGEPLFQELNLTLNPGERVLITAASGAGKSTLVRSLTGIWPYYTGQIEMPLPSRRLVLQQNPYFPVGSLRAALAYPNEVKDFETEDYFAALILADLPALTSLLDESDHWSQRLSSGERQRLSLARAFLQKPELLLLDEATSALSTEVETALLTRLLERLPNLTLMTLAPTGSTLEQHHQTIHDLSRKE
jgi:putative ATP-binding cassette transporter